MVIKGNARGGAAQLAAHLKRTDTNESVQVRELRDVAAQDLEGAIHEMDAMGSALQTKRTLYHASLNTRADEVLTDEQRTMAIDRLEEKLGLTGQPRAVIEHKKEGRAHYHIVWSRADLEHMRAIRCDHNYRKHEEVARELEREFGHERVQGAHAERDGQQRPDRTPSHAEMQQGERSGLTPKEAKAWITTLWQATDSGKAFAAALESQGWRLARGDKRDFVLIDPHGSTHSLARRIEGAKAKDVRERMADIDLANLPSVADARAEQQQAREPPQQDKAQIPDPTPAGDPPKERPLSKTAGEIRMAWNLTESGQGFAAALEDRGIILARATDEDARQSDRDRAFAKEVGRFARSFKEGELLAVDRYGHVYPLDPRTLGTDRTAIDKHLSTVDRSSLLSVADARDVMREARQTEFDNKRAEQQAARPKTRMETKIGEIQNAAATPQAFGAALYQEGITIARVDAEGKAKLEIEAQIAFHEQRMAGKEDAELRLPNFREGELVAVNRFGGVHRLNPMKLNLKEIEAALTTGNRKIPSMGSVREFIAEDRAAEKTQNARRREERGKEYAERRDAATEARIEAWEKWAGSQHGNKQAAHEEPGDARAAVKGISVVLDAAGKATEKLADFISGLFDSGSAPPAARVISPDEYLADPAVRGLYHAQQGAERASNDALDRMRTDMEAGRMLRAEDVRSLSREHLVNLSAKGDDYLRQIIADREQEMRDYGGRDREW